jgi:HSP20 family molecular chaperone IbpA
MHVYKAVGRRKRDGEFSGELVARYVAANEHEARLKASEAFLLGSRRATIENGVLHVELTNESPDALQQRGRRRVHFAETHRPDGGPDRQWHRNWP